MACPGTWKHGLNPAASLWFNFSPIPKKTYSWLLAPGSGWDEVQDAKLDKIWGTPGPTAALNAFLRLAPEGEFVAPRIARGFVLLPELMGFSML